MEFYEFNKTDKDENGDDIIINRYHCTFEGGTLHIGIITTDDEGNDIISPSMVQPWKCNGDGTNESFIDDKDAFAWAEYFIKTHH